MRYGISLNISRCSGCLSCVVTCMDQNDTAENELSFQHVSKVETGTYPPARISFISLACFRCSDAPCIHACYKKTDKLRKMDFAGNLRNLFFLLYSRYIDHICNSGGLKHEMTVYQILWLGFFLKRVDC